MKKFIIILLSILFTLIQCGCERKTVEIFIYSGVSETGYLSPDLTLDRIAELNGEVIEYHESYYFDILQTDYDTFEKTGDYATKDNLLEFNHRFVSLPGLEDGVILIPGNPIEAGTSVLLKYPTGGDNYFLMGDKTSSYLLINSYMNLDDRSKTDTFTVGTWQGGDESVCYMSYNSLKNLRESLRSVSKYAEESFYGVTVKVQEKDITAVIEKIKEMGLCYELVGIEKD